MNMGWVYNCACHKCDLYTCEHSSYRYTVHIMTLNVSEHHFNMSRHYFAVCVFLVHKEGFSQEHAVHCYRLIKIHTKLC